MRWVLSLDSLGPDNRSIARAQTNVTIRIASSYDTFERIPCSEGCQKSAREAVRGGIHGEPNCETTCFATAMGPDRPTESRKAGHGTRAPSILFTPVLPLPAWMASLPWAGADPLQLTQEEPS